MDLFELDKKQVKTSFSAASVSYDALAVLQRNAADKLMQDYVIDQSAGHLLDLGCGTGYLTSYLAKQQSVKSITAIDIAYSMLQVARCRLKRYSTLHYLCADAESLPVRTGSMDWVLSNVALQWCRNIKAVFEDVNRCLSPQGHFVFTTFGPQTLFELKQAWSKVDNYTHINEFYSEAYLIDVLQQCGFNKIQSESCCYESKYDKVLHLMRELKGIGAHNVTQGRNRAMTGKSKFNRMVEAYQNQCDSNDITATFEIIFIAAQKQ